VAGVRPDGAVACFDHGKVAVVRAAGQVGQADQAVEHLALDFNVVLGKGERFELRPQPVGRGRVPCAGSCVPCLSPLPQPAILLRLAASCDPAEQPHPPSRPLVCRPIHIRMTCRVPGL
jgi:hypothetical protein